MPICAENGLDMPDDFPASEFIAFMFEARRVLNASSGGSPAWSQFAGASNLIGWRFRASYEGWLEYRSSIERIGDAADHEELYKRERSLFLMLSAGYSCIESLCYALAAAVSHPSVFGIAFGVEEQRICTAKRLSSWLAPYTKADILASSLNNLLNAKEWDFWIRLRHRVTHRSNLPRQIFVAIGSVPPPRKPLIFAATSSTPEIDADLSDFDALHKWLANTVRDLLIAGKELMRGV
jgi:hypothetical protein